MASSPWIKQGVSATGFMVKVINPYMKTGGGGGAFTIVTPARAAVAISKGDGLALTADGSYTNAPAQSLELFRTNQRLGINTNYLVLALSSNRFVSFYTYSYNVSSRTLNVHTLNADNTVTTNSIQISDGYSSLNGATLTRINDTQFILEVRYNNSGNFYNFLHLINVSSTGVPSKGATLNLANVPNAISSTEDVYMCDFCATAADPKILLGVISRDTGSNVITCRAITFTIGASNNTLTGSLPNNMSIGSNVDSVKRVIPDPVNPTSVIWQYERYNSSSDNICINRLSNTGASTQLYYKSGDSYGYGGISQINNQYFYFPTYYHTTSYDTYTVNLLSYSSPGSLVSSNAVGMSFNSNPAQAPGNGALFQINKKLEEYNLTNMIIQRVTFTSAGGTVPNSWISDVKAISGTISKVIPLSNTVCYLLGSVNDYVVRPVNKKFAIAEGAAASGGMVIGLT